VLQTRDPVFADLCPKLGATASYMEMRTFQGRGCIFATMVSTSFWHRCEPL